MRIAYLNEIDIICQWRSSFFIYGKIENSKRHGGMVLILTDRNKKILFTTTLLVNLSKILSFSVIIHSFCVFA